MIFQRKKESAGRGFAQAGLLKTGRQAAKLLTELLFPTRCPGCDELLYPTERQQGFCSRCRPYVKKIDDCHCMKCGRQLEEAEKEYCRDCEMRQHVFTQNKAVYSYRGVMKSSMYRFKYGNRREYVRTFGKDAMEAYGRWILEKDISGIVPVPMYRAKQRRRGYNQAEVFADEIARQTGIPVYRGLVVRIRSTVPQKNLNPAERKYNLKNAFKIMKTGVKLKHTLVVDDIYTTGSTMDGVAGVLRMAGADEVYGLSICIGRDK